MRRFNVSERPLDELAALSDGSEHIYALGGLASLRIGKLGVTRLIVAEPCRDGSAAIIITEAAGRTSAHRRSRAH